ncbi:hypothetical protein [Altererythrobacter sp. MF3-039]|uniref:hypothetical protein n=1 Tax=Altererythrobacter sp. MF3-039 TaxID=3252901 RepID=UPI00390C748A
MTEGSNFLTTKKRPRPLLVVAIALFHVLVLYGLMRALAPDFTANVQDTVVEAFTVTITTPEDEPVEPEPDAGAAGSAGGEAIPKPKSAETPKVPIRQDEAMPRTASTGDANTSGARDSGDGTGASGDGLGTGSGNSGSGQGSVASGPSVRSGELNQARDFPIPEGGRQTRFGRSVTVVFTVGTDGRASNCSVARTSVDPETTAAVCPLVIQKIRFNPARNADGDPIAARYGYRVDFRPS